MDSLVGELYIVMFPNLHFTCIKVWLGVKPPKENQKNNFFEEHKVHVNKKGKGVHEILKVETKNKIIKVEIRMKRDY